MDDDDTAHEIASEAFTRLLARWSGLDNPQSYLYMIAANLVRDHWRKSGRERRAIRSLTAAAPADPACHPAQDVDVRADRGAARAAAQRVPAALLRRLWRPRGHRDAGPPEGTVKADLHHARARLKTALGTRQDKPIRDTR